ncbi:MAG: hypothetical protein AAGF60_13235 [Pseudomonadota bacterium]
MTRDTHSVALSQEELDLIAAALQTQEKILSVQARAGGKTAGLRLSALKALSRRLNAQRPRTDAAPIWTRLSRALPCHKTGAA